MTPVGGTDLIAVPKRSADSGSDRLLPNVEVDEARYSSFFKESTSLLLEESDTHHSSMEILEGFGRGFCDRSSERASHFAHPIAHLMARRSNSRYWGKSHEHLSTWGYQSLIGSMSQCPRQWPRVL
jgi:hypothetical protein